MATILLRSIFIDLRLHDLPRNEYTSVYVQFRPVGTLTGVGTRLLCPVR